MFSLSDREAKSIVQPIVKWAGGKRQIITVLMKLVPKNFMNYFEPFFGGGALFFELYKNNLINRAYLNDKNNDLINMYSIIKESPEQLISELTENLLYVNDDETFYHLRDEVLISEVNQIKKAAIFVYLNHTCYNGLYRVNKSGKFNVPFGYYKTTKLFSKEEGSISESFVNLLKSVSISFNSVDLFSGDFEKILETCKKDDFVYLDPPYLPPINKKLFTDYTRLGFDITDHQRLFRQMKFLDELECKFLLSNSTNQVVADMYKDAGYTVNTVLARRSINCNPDGRGKIKELLVYNYDKKDCRNSTIQTIL